MGQFFDQPDFATVATAVVVGTTDVRNSALYIGTGGNVEVIAVGSTASVIFKNIADGSFLPCIITSIVAGDGTTATDIIAIK